MTSAKKKAPKKKAPKKKAPKKKAPKKKAPKKKAAKKKAAKKKAAKKKAAKKKAAKKKAAKKTRRTTTTTHKTTTTRTVNPGRPLQRGPIPLEDMRVTDLDRTKVIEARTPTHIYSWKSGLPLLWDPVRRAFLWFQGADLKRIAAYPTSGGKTKRVHDAWSWRGRQATTDTELLVPALRGGWRKIGRLVSIAYRSPKDGRSADYQHPVDTSAQLYRFGGTRPPWIWVAKGGRLNVTSRGIIG